MWGVGTAKGEIEGRLKPHESLETFQAKVDNYHIPAVDLIY